MAEIYLVRYGETDRNKEHRFQVGNGMVRVTGVNDPCLMKESHGPG